MWGGAVGTMWGWEWLNEWAVAVWICAETRANDCLAPVKTQLVDYTKGEIQKRRETHSSLIDRSCQHVLESDQSTEGK